eukprot:TRINITY_DN60879_c0_g1_i1.p2 TRINITY_DN60879_c0_g1~~TRINITY_DN60879_c0_g1_i1.p2  ORF type:complete len:116 (+),score=42.01 TRINITY_DN60879_c0_g1_i1:450-797(+)
MARFVPEPRLQEQRKYRLPFRLGASILPIVGACFVSNLATVLEWTGSVGILIAFVFPCALQYNSVRLCKQMFGPVGHHTQYHSHFWSSLRLVRMVAVCACSGFVLVMAFNVMNDS